MDIPIEYAYIAFGLAWIVGGWIAHALVKRRQQKGEKGLTRTREDGSQLEN